MNQREVEHSPEYRALLSSARWKALRKERIRRAMHRCERCQRAQGDRRNLQLHHLTYERLGRELDTDLILLCKKCHEIADIERRDAVLARVEERQWTARIDGWAQKVYGEDWQLTHEIEDVEELFKEWLERRGE